MMNARYAGVALIALVAMAIVASVVQSALPPSSRRLAPDTYSGAQSGHRALLEVLQELDVAATRSGDLPPVLFSGEKRILLLSPDPWRLARERAYLHDMGDWVRGGGELLIVSDTLDNLQECTACALSGEGTCEGDDQPEPSLLRILGFEGLDLVRGDELEMLGDVSEPMIHFATFGADEPITYSLRASGSLSHLTAEMDAISTPVTKPAHFAGASLAGAQGKVEIDLGETEGEEDWRPIAVDYTVGQGSVTLVSTPYPFTNIGIGREDNAIFAVRLSVGGGRRPVAVDDFYYGRASEGNWLSLLTVYPYGAIALFILLAAVLCGWQSAVRFGPAVPEAPPNRRDIVEYVDAMARLFRRGRASAFALRANRDGFADSLREVFHLPYSAPESVLLHRFSQVAPGKSEELEALLAEVDRTLQSGERVSQAALLHHQERLDQCLTATLATPTQRKTRPSHQTPAPTRPMV